MRAIAGLIGFLAVLLVLWEAFETVILPRRIQRKFRFTRFFYLATWIPWRKAAGLLQNPKKREAMLSFYGPLSLVTLFAAWALLLGLAFALMYWYVEPQLKAVNGAPMNFASDLYLSGTTLFTLGLGDITPQSGPARALAISEAAIGFGLIALAISYLPTLNQAFANREVNISLLDARAGSPPAAAEFFHRYAAKQDLQAVTKYLEECERWASELLESHMSYPALCYFRSQHANQSWISGLTMVLDVCVLAQMCGKEAQHWQAELTFAMARHAVVDLSQIFHLGTSLPGKDRLPPQDLNRLRSILAADGLELQAGPKAEAKMKKLRDLYEPYAQVLAKFLAMDLAPWLHDPGKKDNWSTSPAPGSGQVQ